MGPGYREHPTAGLRALCAHTASGLPFIMVPMTPCFLALTPMKRARGMQTDVPNAVCLKISPLIVDCIMSF